MILDVFDRFEREIVTVMTRTQVYARSFGIGIVAGLRSMTAPAAVRLAAKDAGSRILEIVALGELIADKLPGIPARTSLPALAVRAATGAFAGGATCAAYREDRAKGALLGALGAIAGSYIALELRQRAVQSTGLPDRAIALVEDALAVTSGLLLRA